MKLKKSFQTFFKSGVFVQVLVITVFLVALFIFHWSLYIPRLPATLTLSLGDGTRTFQGEVFHNMTVLDALNAAMVAGKINLEYSMDNKELTVLKINDHLNNVGGKSFNFYLNSKEVDPKNLSKIHVEPGDNIEIRFE